MMQTIMTWLLIVGLPQGLAMALADPKVDDSPETVKTIVVRRVGDAQDDNKTVFQVGSTGSTGAKALAIASVGRDAHSADRGWLGVSIAKVPEALSAQFELDGNGLLVTNVIEGGPADKAGIGEHDVILSVDDQAVTGDYNELLDLLANRKPGDTVEVVALRGGQEKTFEVELGSKAAVNKFAWKFDVDETLGEVDEHVRTSGKFLTRDDDGKWQVLDLGDLSKLDSLKDLPERFRELIPQSGDRKIRVSALDGTRTVKSTVTRDGASVTVSQENGGDIVVTRTDVDGNETEATYATEEDLKAADSEAFDIFKNAGNVVTINLGVDGTNEGSDYSFTFGFDKNFNADDLQDKLLSWEQQMNGALGDVEAARGELTDHLSELLQDLKNGDASGLEQLDWLPLLGAGGTKDHFLIAGRHARARQSFEVRPDGTIAVTVRKGDSEVVTVYTDENDLATRAPDLYEKFSDVLNDDSVEEGDQ